MTDHPVHVMHMTDSLNAGGAERLAVNLANLMPREQYRLWFCTTRCEGCLAPLLAADVTRLHLNRTSTLDWTALRRLLLCIRREEIQILHAHDSSLFLAAAVASFAPFPAVVWHNHFGRYALEDRRAWFHRLAVKRAAAVIAVSRPLLEWSHRRLAVPADRLWYIRNFVSENGAPPCLGDVPGTRGARIVCVANLRPEKNHRILIRAMAQVVSRISHAHLLLIGGPGRPYDTSEAVRHEIRQHRLERHVSLLGHRDDVSGILRQCDVGVLSSVSEGLPLSLLEYGMAALPAVATAVGQCAEVLDDGAAGILVAPGAVDDLAASLVALLDCPQRRAVLGQRLRQRVRSLYSADAAVAQVSSLYGFVLAGRRLQHRA